MRLIGTSGSSSPTLGTSKSWLDGGCWNRLDINLLEQWLGDICILVLEIVITKQGLLHVVVT